MPVLMSPSNVESYGEWDDIGRIDEVHVAKDMFFDAITKGSLRHWHTGALFILDEALSTRGAYSG
jgi:hypothetical protein